MIDDILLKSVSNKRWVKNLCEAQTSFLNKLDPIILKYCNLGSIFGITTKQIIGLAIIGDALSLPASTKNLELEMKNMCEQETSISFFGNKIINCGDSYTKKDIIVFAPVIFLDLDLKSNSYENRYEIIFNTAKSKSDILSAEQLLINYLTRNNYTFWGDSLSYINKTFPSLIDKLERFSNKNNIENKENNYEDDYENSGDFEINQINIKQKENIKPDISKKFDAKSEIIWNAKVADKRALKKNDDTEGVVPEIKTNLVVNDEKFRTLTNTCNMIMNNVEKMKNDLKIFSNDEKTHKVLLYSDEDILDQYDFFNRHWSQRELNKQNEKYPEALQYFSTEEAETIQARVCYVYYQAALMAKNGNFDTDFKYSRGLNYCLHNYLIELISPMSIIKNKISWNTLNGQNGCDVLSRIVGLDSSQWESKSYIMYPLSFNQKLYDSIVNLNGKILKVSTKGGLDGKGAFASIKSLREYVFEGENGYGNITKFGKKIQNEYPDLFNIFDILTGKEDRTSLSNNEWESMYQSISKKLGKKAINKHKHIQDYINKDVNTSWTKMIMKILESASYDFIQVNARALSSKNNKDEEINNEKLAKKLSTSNDFHFKYAAQYPAVFSGKVKIQIDENGKATFHIE